MDNSGFGDLFRKHMQSAQEAMLTDPATSTSAVLQKTVLEAVQDYIVTDTYYGALELDEVDVHANIVPCTLMVRMHPHSRRGYLLLTQMTQNLGESITHPGAEHSHSHGLVYTSVYTEEDRMTAESLGQEVYDELIASIREAVQQGIPGAAVALEEALKNGIPTLEQKQDFIISAAIWPVITMLAVQMGVQIYFGPHCPENHDERALERQ